MNRYCPNCGVEAVQGAAFCAGCGTAVPEGPLNLRSDAAVSAAVPTGGNGRAIRWALGVGALLVMSLLGLFTLGMIGLLNTGFAGLLVGMVLGTLPVPIYLALALWIDRFEKEPIWMLAGAFVWGATGAVFFSLILNSINGAIVGAVFGAGVGDLFGSVISAPVVEESAKGLALFILYWWKKDEFDGVMDGIVYAAMVGLGFAMVENFSYYGSMFVEGGIGGSIVLFVVRGVISPFNHPLFTSMTGIGLGLARQSTRTWVKFVAPVAGLLAAMMAHSLWNLSGSLPLGLLGLIIPVLFIEVPLMVGILVVIFFALRREGNVVRRYLTPELQSGLLSQHEYDALTSVRGRLGASFGALTGGGFTAWRRQARLNQTASELAFHRDRVARGIASTNDAEREGAYVQSLQELKAPPPSDERGVVTQGEEAR